MLWADNNVSLPNNYYSSLGQIKTLERRLMKDRKLRERHADTIREDIKKGQFITVQPYDPRALTDWEWYLLQYPVRTPNKPGKVRRVPKGLLIQSLLVGPDILQNLIFVLLSIQPHTFSVSAEFRGYVSPGRSPRWRSNSLRFVAEGSHIGCGSPAAVY